MNVYPQPRQSDAADHLIPFAATMLPQSTMNRKRILIVDDSTIILKTLSMKLKSNGYEVLTAADGGTAVSLVRREKPDLILLDISFPPDVAHGGGVAWDGFLIMSWLGRMEEAKNIPIMIITGAEPEKFKERAMAAGAVGYFQKPINNEELLASIRETIGEAPAVPPAAA